MLHFKQFLLLISAFLLVNSQDFSGGSVIQENEQNIISVLQYLNQKPENRYNYKTGQYVDSQLKADILQLVTDVAVTCKIQHPGIPCVDTTLRCVSFLRKNTQNSQFTVLSSTCKPIEEPSFEKSDVTLNSAAQLAKPSDIYLSQESVNSDQTPDFVAIRDSVAPCLGCPFDLNTNSVGVNVLLETALRHIESERNEKHAVVKVIRFQEQIVSGVKYILLIEIAPTVCPKNSGTSSCPIDENKESFTCEVIYFQKPWLSSAKHIIKNNCTNSQEFLSIEDKPFKETVKHPIRETSNDFLAELESQIIPDTPRQPNVVNYEEPNRSKVNTNFQTPSEIVEQQKEEVNYDVQTTDTNTDEGNVNEQGSPEVETTTTNTNEISQDSEHGDIQLTEETALTQNADNVEPQLIVRVRRDNDVENDKNNERSKRKIKKEDNDESDSSSSESNSDEIKQKKSEKETDSSSSSDEEKTSIKHNKNNNNNDDDSSSSSSDEDEHNKNKATTKTSKNDVDDDNSSSSTDENDNQQNKMTRKMSKNKVDDDSSSSSSSSEEDDKQNKMTVKMSKNQVDDDSSSSSSDDDDKQNKMTMKMSKNRVDDDDSSSSSSDEDNNQQKNINTSKKDDSSSSSSSSSDDDDNIQKMKIHKLSNKEDGKSDSDSSSSSSSSDEEVRYYKVVKDDDVVTLRYSDEDNDINVKVVKKRSVGHLDNLSEDDMLDVKKLSKIAAKELGASKSKIEILDADKIKIDGVYYILKLYFDKQLCTVTMHIDDSELEMVKMVKKDCVKEDKVKYNRHRRHTADIENGKPHRNIPGGIVPIEPTDEMKSFVTDGLLQLDSTSSHTNRYKIKKFLTTTTQVVAGQMIRIEAEVVMSDCAKTSDKSLEECGELEGEPVRICKFNIWNRPWLPQGRETTVKCKDGETLTFKSKRSIEDNYDLRPLDYYTQKELFDTFTALFNKTYQNKIEYNFRFKVFSNNLNTIRIMNKFEQGTAKYGFTKFADLTHEEFSRSHGLRLNLRTENELPFAQAQIPNIDLPTEFDWRKKNAVTEVKNQGQCGSCWAFSTTGNIEGQYAIKYNKLLEFSEQELVDCDKSDDGCDGGLMDNAYRYIEKLGGLESEQDYPYDAEDEKCHFDKNKVRVKLSGALNISQDETEMAKWLVANGPISIAINANAMQFYVGGVSHPWKMLCNPKELDHGVLIVGYGVHKYSLFNKTLPYWIVKNSWGKDWGEQGYYRVYRGDGTCGVNQTPSSGLVV